MLNLSAGIPYCLTIRHRHRLPMFYEYVDYRFCLSLIEQCLQRYGLHLHAFVLMFNYSYLLLTSPLKMQIVKLQDDLDSQYGDYFNIRNRRVRNLLQLEFSMVTVKVDDHLLLYNRYIELAPVRSGRVLHPADYPWSSYACNALGEDTGLLTPHRPYLLLGDNPESRRSRYRQLFEEPEFENSPSCRPQPPVAQAFHSGF